MSTTTAHIAALLAPIGAPVGHGGWHQPSGDPLPDSAVALLVHPVDSPLVARRVTGRAHGITGTFYIVCVGTDPTGAETLAAAAVDSLDGVLAPAGGAARVTGLGPVLEDRNDPSRWRWTRTVTVTVTDPR